MNDKSDNQNDNSLDQIFDEVKLDQAIARGKRKATQKLVLISLAVAVFVFIVLNVGNFFLMINISNKSFQWMDAYVKLTVPNGYISKSVEDFSFLEGRRDYTISRIVGDKPVVLENQTQAFGYLPRAYMSRVQGGGGQTAGQWPTNYWEYGYRKMIFFHPLISYKAYKDDLADLSQIADNKLIEVGVSYDKPYTISELSSIFPNENISWYWVDAFQDEDKKRYEQEAKEYDAQAAFISEYEALGVDMTLQGSNDFASRYNDFLFNLKTSQNPKFMDIYNGLKAKGYTDAAKVPILGAIVYGTKEQLKTLVGSPHIKASSFGVIIDKY